MKVDFSGNAKTLDGVDLKDEKGAVIKISAVVQNALLVPERDQKADDKAKSYHYAIKLVEKQILELSTEDAAYIKAKIGKNVQLPLLVGQLFLLFDKKTTK